jgi:predicted DNA-binding transcriptional regulator YafY
VKSDRLLAILLLLQDRGRVPADELATRLEVSVRTVYRDVTALSAAGVPVYAERGRHGGIALLAGYRTDVTGLTRDESRALFVMAARGVHADLGLDRALASALRKVMAALPEPHRPDAALASERIIVDPAGWMRPPQPSPALVTLQHAVFADRRVRLAYRHGGDTTVHRYTVDPYGLVDKAGVWYLVADHRRRPRLFRVSRIRAADLTDAPVRRRPGVELAAVWDVLRRAVENRPDAVTVRVLVRREVLGMFRRICAPHLLPDPVRDAGDAVELALGFRATGAARTLLAFGDAVTVLDPPSVRDDLLATARAVTAHYG